MNELDYKMQLEKYEESYITWKSISFVLITINLLAILIFWVFPTSSPLLVKNLLYTQQENEKIDKKLDIIMEKVRPHRHKGIYGEVDY